MHSGAINHVLGVQAMISRAQLSAVATLAQECWVQHMREQGWTPGSTFDAAARTHDAMWPLSTLDDDDQIRVLSTLRDADVGTVLSRMVSHERGVDRCFGPREIRVGLEVTWADDIVNNAHAPRMPRPIGRIVAWTIDPEIGDVQVISVEWDDGERSRHLNADRELRRLDPQGDVP
jgi:hypothetical protein